MLSCTGKNPGTATFVGKWRAADSAQLFLQNNGSFIGKSLPTKVFFQRDDTSHPMYFNGQGHWSIQEWKFQWPKIALDFDSTDINLKFSCYVYISGTGFWETNPPWDILFQWKGEEGGERYEFKRQVFRK